LAQKTAIAGRITGVIAATTGKIFVGILDIRHLDMMTKAPGLRLWRFYFRYSCALFTTSTTRCNTHTGDSDNTVDRPAGCTGDSSSGDDRNSAAATYGDDANAGYANNGDGAGSDDDASADDASDGATSGDDAHIRSGEYRDATSSDSGPFAQPSRRSARFSARAHWSEAARRWHAEQ
jgi:hypothetical protein